jgi:ribonuclease D
MIYIDNNQALAQACSGWTELPRIALDSEFMRVDTFYPILALIQINDGSESYLIDPISIDEWQPLNDIFTNEKIVKVLHSPSEDFDAFFHNLGVLPKPIFDTQLAASMASQGGIMGYQKLVKHILDVDLDKGETRSDWMKRPLSDSQLHYAAEDVNYLLEISQKLEDILVQQGRLDWLLEDCDNMLTNWLENQKAGYSYERVKKAWMVKHHQLNVLNELVLWREKRCKEVNKPRGHLIKDDLLMEVATRLPQSTGQLASIKGIRPATLRKEGQQIIDVVKASNNVDESQWPERLPRPLSQAAGEWFKKMRKLVNNMAEELDVPPELLARKKPMETMLRQGYPRGPFVMHKDFQGWREEQVAKPLLTLLNKLAQKA